MPQISFVVCSTQRSGSSLLCKLMRQTRVMGSPGEHLPIPKVRKHAESNGMQLMESAMKILEDSASKNRVSGVKFHYHQFIQFSQYLNLNEIITDPVWIYIDRRDLLGQAISLTRAWQTRKFSSKHEAIEGKGEEYDFREIMKAGLFLSQEKSLWEWFFASNQIIPFRVIYEDLLDDPSDIITQIALAAGISYEGKVSADRIDITIQRDYVTEEWRSRYLVEVKAANFSCFEDQKKL